MALQKARGAALLSSPDAAGILGGYAFAFAGFTGRTLGSVAMSARAIENLTRPFTPDGIDGTTNGPFSRPYPGGGGSTWSVFNTGLFLDAVFPGIVSSVQNP